MFRSVSKDSEGKRYFTRDFSTACLPRIATASQGVAGSAKLAMDSNDDAELPGPPKSIVKKAMLFYNIGDVRKDCNRNPKGDTISFVTASRRHQEEEKCCGWIPRTPLSGELTVLPIRHQKCALNARCCSSLLILGGTFYIFRTQ
jgi:hypothetical protein